MVGGGNTLLVGQRNKAEKKELIQQANRERTAARKGGKIKQELVDDEGAEVSGEIKYGILWEPCVAWSCGGARKRMAVEGVVRGEENCKGLVTDEEHRVRVKTYWVIV